MQEKIRNTLFWLILLQPFLEIYWLYNGSFAQVLPFTIPTILRLVGVFVIFLLYFSQKSNWLNLRKNWFLLAYVFVLIIYSAAHLYFTRNFKSLDPTSYGYSTLGEAFYLIRMALPLIVLYVTQETPFSEKSFNKIIQGLVGSIAGIIVVTDICKISLTSYGRPQLIKINIFEWFFKHQPSFYQMAAKGWFNFANTTSAVLFMLMPLMLYVLVTKTNWLNILLVVLQSMAMLMLGTKVALYGLAISFAAFVIIYLLHVFIIKNLQFSKKIAITTLLIIIGIGLIAPASPAVKRTSFDAAIVKTRNKKSHKDALNKELSPNLKHGSKAKKKKFLKKFIKRHYQAFALQHRFVFHSYNYKRDPYFWLHVMRLPESERLNNRLIEARMLDQVKVNNHNSVCDWLGISYMRESHIFPLERDFMSQYYSLGIIGAILFLGIYVLALLYAVFNWIKNKADRSFKQTMLIISMTFIIVAAFYSGNVMDFLFATIIMAFILGYLLQIINVHKHSSKYEFSMK